MKAVVNCLLLVAVMLAAFGTVSAQEGMPMGPPEEMKQMHFLVGDWVGNMKWRMADTSEQWMDATARTHYELILDGGAIEGTTEIDMMGQTMKGKSIDCYDPEKKEWQMMWIDGMTPRMRVYTGKEEDGKMVLYGEEVMMGQAFPAKIIVDPQSDTEFLWEMHYSNDGGETWWVSGMATYKKRQ